jgi:GAF domain-containing protein
MAAQRDLAGWMARIATQLRDADGEQRTVDAIVATAGEVVSGTAAASITVRRSRAHETLASSSALAAEADALQYATDEGPCLDAADDHVEFTRSGDVRTDPRWRVWGPQAAALGVGSMLSLPLLAQDGRIGALNLYATELDQFAERETIDLALLYAVHAAHALTSARTESNLRVAMTSRHVIGVAQGIVMERYDLDLQQSFALLRRVSSQTNTKLIAIAEGVVATGAVPTVEDA